MAPSVVVAAVNGPFFGATRGNPWCADLSAEGSGYCVYARAQRSALLLKLTT
jgi:hypothetical protein